MGKEGWTKVKRRMNCWRRFQEEKGQVLRREAQET